MKNHIFSIILAAVCCAFASCNQNTPDDTKKGGDTPTSQHQPSDPASWSPVGKRYVRDLSVSHGYDCLFQVVWFRTGDSAVIYDSTTPDIMQMDNNIIHCSYTIDYPNVPMNFFKDFYKPDNFHFADTLTLYNPSEPWAFILTN